MTDDAPQVPPDTKDWTWVLDRPCPDCGFVATDLDVGRVSAEVLRLADRYVALLADERSSQRPVPETWSATEYACHVRDVFALFDLRLHRMLDEDDPLFANWDQDVTAIEDDYASQSPDRVGPELTEAAARIASSFAEIAGEQWRRGGRRSDGAQFTVDSFARYFLHDPVHHIWDIEQGYALLG